MICAPAVMPQLHELLFGVYRLNALSPPNSPTVHCDCSIGATRTSLMSASPVKAANEGIKQKHPTSATSAVRKSDMAFISFMFKILLNPDACHKSNPREDFVSRTFCGTLRTGASPACRTSARRTPGCANSDGGRLTIPHKGHLNKRYGGSGHAETSVWLAFAAYPRHYSKSQVER